MLKGLSPILNLMALAFYRWAMREIDPMHDDVPHIARRIAELETQ